MCGWGWNFVEYLALTLGACCLGFFLPFAGGDDGGGEAEGEVAGGGAAAGQDFAGVDPRQRLLAILHFAFTHLHSATATVTGAALKGQVETFAAQGIEQVGLARHKAIVAGGQFYANGR